MLLLNKDEFKLYTGNPFGNTASPEMFDAAVRNVEWTDAEACINPDLIALLKTGTYGPEVEAFYNDYIKPWYANAVKLYLIKQNNNAVTNAGVRTPNTQTSNQTGDLQLNVLQSNAEKLTKQMQERMLNRYAEVSYVFDDVAYPPVPRMRAYYNTAWNGYTYLRGRNGWGWYGPSGALFDSVIDRVNTNSSFQIIGINNPIDY